MLNILNPKFRCFPESEDAVTYRAEVSGTQAASAVEIANYIEDWLADGAIVAFEFLLIPVDSTCQVILTSIADPECINPTPISPTSIQFPVAAVGGAISAVIFLIVICTIMIVMIYIRIHKKRAKSFNLSKNRFEMLIYVYFYWEMCTYTGQQLR